MIENILLQAIALHQAGQLEDAGRLYLSILRTQPNHPEANHNLGILAVQAEQAAAGLPYLVTALEANPTHGQYWLSYIDALIQADQLDTADEILEVSQQQGLHGEALEELKSRLATAKSKNQPYEQSNELSPPPLPQGGNPDNLEIDKLVNIFTQGQYDEAIVIAQILTRAYPQHSFGWKVMGAAYMQVGRTAEALLPMREAVTLSPGDVEALYNLGVIQQGLGHLNEAETSYRHALRVDDDYADAHGNLGVILQSQGQLDEAAARYRRTLELNPKNILARINLGVCLHDMGLLDEAEASYLIALQLAPDNADALSNLGNTLQNLHRFTEAESCYRRALEIKPGYPDAHYNLGNLLHDLGRLIESEECFRRALEIKPDYIEALNNLALLLDEQGKSATGLKIIQKSLHIRETSKARSIFFTCAKHLQIAEIDGETRENLVKALTTPWGKPSELVRICMDVVKLDDAILACVTQASMAWPQRLSAAQLFGMNGYTATSATPLLAAILTATPICDLEMERFLTMVRHAMLETSTTVGNCDSEDDASLDFYCAIALQCFINEYVFSYTDSEIQKATGLRDTVAKALADNAQIPASWLIAVAAYFPLHTLSSSSRLLERAWPESVVPVLLQQVREPEEEMRLRSSIPRLTDIEDAISILVQSQYEENPYPRWVKTALGSQPATVDNVLRRIFPLVSFSASGNRDNPEILIAGCGTGQQSISTAQRFSGAQVLAVDLSLSSLCYAKRKTSELGLTAIEYAQADLLKLGELGRSFDIVESTGVLHHLADPWAGWKVLLSLLRPGGFMKIGLYSKIARQDIAQMRTLISHWGYGPSAAEIRQCRQDLIDSEKKYDFMATLNSPDFFSTSSCRDLLFHAQEHLMSLSSIDEFLRKNNVGFLGFEIESKVLHAYKLRFPEDHTATNLKLWQTFENENPDTFANMYQFWIQKKIVEI